MKEPCLPTGIKALRRAPQRGEEQQLSRWDTRKAEGQMKGRYSTGHFLPAAVWRADTTAFSAQSEGATHGGLTAAGRPSPSSPSTETALPPFSYREDPTCD